MRSCHTLTFILLTCVVSSAFGAGLLDANKASRWFQSEVSPMLKGSSADDSTPVIYGGSISTLAMMCGDPRSDINAYVFDPSGVRTVYAMVGRRINLMLDLDKDNRYTGYCGSNLPAGIYPVIIIAVDKDGNTARKVIGNITIQDPNDMDGDHVEDTLDRKTSEDQKVIVLHDGNLTSEPGASNFKVLPGSSLTVPGNKITELAETEGVKGVYKDQKLKVLAVPGKFSESEGPSKVDDPRKGHDLKGDGVTMVLIDTGVDPHHVAFQGGNKIIAFKDFVNGLTEPYDDNGHGTHCASLIAGGGEVPGVAPDAKLVVVKVMDRDGACYLSDAIKALDWCLENKDKYGIKVISFSVGGEGPSEGNSILDDACNNVVDKGITMVVAAGNSGPYPSSIVMPGDASKVITVGAIDNKGEIFEKSSRGPTPEGDVKPDLVTLGVDVISALAGSTKDYSPVSGTSMAVPQVSGSAALILEAEPDLKPADVKRVLIKTADDLGDPEPDNVYGSGSLNLTRALEDMGRLGSMGAELKAVDLSRASAMVGDPVVIEARAHGDVKEVKSVVRGPGDSMEMSMDDFDNNGTYSTWLDTSLLAPGSYEIEVNLEGEYGEVVSRKVPFQLRPRS